MRVPLNCQILIQNLISSQGGLILYLDIKEFSNQMTERFNLDEVPELKRVGASCSKVCACKAGSFTYTIEYSYEGWVLTNITQVINN